MIRIIKLLLLLLCTASVSAQNPGKVGQNVPGSSVRKTGTKPTNNTPKPSNPSSQQNGKVTIHGINYSLNTKRKTAEVVSGDYSGDIIIPSTVFYKNVKYRVTSIEGGMGNGGYSYGAFYECDRVTSVTIPNSITSIKSHTFEYCTNLKSVIIPNSVTSIGEEAFSSCENLSSIIIPNSVKEISENAFWGCSGLTSITVSAGNTVYDSRDNCNAIIETSSNTLIVGCKNTVIPNSVTNIGSCAFNGCSGLTSITIPNSVTSINDNPFHGCDNLSSISVSAGNTVYDSRNYCNAVIETNSNELIVGCKNTVIPYSVESIGSWAFADCSGLTSITIPQSVTSIGGEAFDGCEKLQSITCLATEVPGADDFAFYNDFSKVEPVSQVKNATLYVPSEAIDAYKNTYPWSGFKSIQPIK